MRCAVPLLSAVLLAAAQAAVAAPSPLHAAPVVGAASSSYSPVASDSNGLPLASCDGCTNTRNIYPSPPRVHESDPRVTTAQGTYAGKYLSHVSANGTYGRLGVSHPQDLFLGIPYAKPPVGSRRFRRASPLDSDDGFQGTRPAKRYAFQCMGVGSDQDYAPPLVEYAIAEDCLALNVVRPAGTPADAKLPVVFWIHGGGFYQGGAADRRYNGSWIVDRSVEMGTPVVFVSVQYRLDALGFPLGEEAAELKINNLGLYDQRVALHWLRENIEAFGGDRDKVTLFGESAGGASVLVHYTAYGGRDEGLFRAAIAHSGYFAVSTASAEKRDEKMKKFARTLGCGGKSSAEETYDCLRGVDFADIAALQRKEYLAAEAASVGFRPVVDGQLISVDLQQAFEEGLFVRRPLISQANSDEGSSFGDPTLNTSSQIIHYLNTQRWLSYTHNLTTTSKGGKKLLAAYPADEDAYCPYSAGDGLSTAGAGKMARRSQGIAGDAIMVGPRRRITERVASTSDAPVYASRFDQVGLNTTMDGGVPHFTDVRYAFSNPLLTQNPLGGKPRDKALAKEMLTYWLSFIATMDPNTHKLESSPHWPKSDPKDPKNIRLTNRADGTRTLIESDTWRKEGIDVLMDIRYQGVKAEQDQRRSAVPGDLWADDVFERSEL